MAPIKKMVGPLASQLPYRAGSRQRHFGVWHLVAVAVLSALATLVAVMAAPQLATGPHAKMLFQARVPPPPPQ